MKAVLQFYTYIHCKPDGTPFYVGKGKGRRSHSFSKRNKHHQNIINKYGKENIKVFVFKCEDEKRALNDEIQKIEHLRSCGYKLCNLTDGGEGSSGRKSSLRQKETVRKIMRERIITREMRHNYSLGQKRRIFSNKEKDHLRGLAMAQRKKVECTTLNTVFDSLAEASMSLGLNKASVSRVCSGQRNSVYGLVFNYI